MFLTRIGFNSKAVVNGDITQVDLPQGRQSGLREAQEVLAGIEGIKFFTFDERDVVRHTLVQKIVTAYDRFDRLKQEREEARPGSLPPPAATVAQPRTPLAPKPAPPAPAPTPLMPPTPDSSASS